MKEKGFVEISGSDVPTHNHSNSKSDISRQNRHIPQESKAVETHFSRANYEPVFPSSEQPDEPISPNTGNEKTSSTICLYIYIIHFRYSSFFKKWLPS